MKKVLTPLIRHIDGQIHKVLANDNYALLMVIIMGMLPLCSLFAMTLTSLVTLRKGAKQGLVLAIAGTAAGVVLETLGAKDTPLLLNDSIAYSLCFIGAITLRQTKNWNVVFGVYIGLVMLVALALQVFGQHYLITQYEWMMALIAKVQTQYQLKLIHVSTPAQQWQLANLLMGLVYAVQLLSVSFVLTWSRSIQSRLFNPGGFDAEKKAFRADKLFLVLFCITSMMMYFTNAYASQIFPVLALFFACAGLILVTQCIERFYKGEVVLFLLLPLMFIPTVMVPVYVLLGILGSLINIPLLLPNKGS